MRCPWIVAVFVALGMLAFNAPSEAAAPQQTTRQEELTLTLRCDGFELYDEAQVDVHIQRFFTNDGNHRHVTVHVRWQGVITNATTGKFITADPGHWQDTFANPTITTRGEVTNIRSADLGVFIRDVGRTIINLRTGDVTFQSSTEVNHQELDALCAALT
jgi:hypothetical protein